MISVETKDIAKPPKMALPAVATVENPGAKTLLFGPPGSGKTHSLRTYLSADPRLEVFCLFTEPSGLSVLGDTDPTRFHWNYVAPSQPSWEAMIDAANKINTFSNDALQKMQGVNKGEYRQFIDVLKQFVNFQCQRCGKEYGRVDTWGTSRVLALDSLSGLNFMALELAVGAKPIRTQPDWGVAIEQEAKLVNMLTLGMQCHFALLAHAGRETDQVMGGIKVYPNALGKGLPQEIGRFFDDLPFSVLEGTEFSWSTMAANVDSKARLLPLAKKLVPSFKPVIEQWLKKGGTIT